MPHLFFSLGISGILLSIDLTFLLTCRVWPRSYLPNRIFYPCSKYSHWYNLLFDGAGFSSGILQVDVALLQSQNCDISLIPNLKVKRKKIFLLNLQQIHHCLSVFLCLQFHQHAEICQSPQKKKQTTKTTTTTTKHTHTNKFHKEVINLYRPSKCDSDYTSISPLQKKTKNKQLMMCS